jgi:hypothetical protein
MSGDKIKWKGKDVVDGIYTSNRWPEETQKKLHCDFCPLFILINHYSL